MFPKTHYLLIILYSDNKNTLDMVVIVFSDNKNTLFADNTWIPPCNEDQITATLNNKLEHAQSPTEVCQPKT